MSAAWYVRSRQMMDKAYFWLAVTGYNSNDRSLNNRFYLVYLVLFFGLWAMGMLGLLTSVVVRALLAIDPHQPGLLAARAGALILLLWWLWKLFGASQRSPIQFTSEDAALVCATPASRQSVVFSWLVGEWFVTGLPFWAVAITLGFTLAEISVGPDQFWPNLGLYLGSGLRFLLPVLLLHPGLLMLVWALGCARLQGSREVEHLFLAPLAVGLAAGGLIWFSTQPGAPLSILSIPWMQPILAGSGQANFLSGLLIALAWLSAGTAGLYTTSRGINLSRAAQETESRAAINAAKITGNEKAARDIRLKQRLQSSSPSPIPARAGAAVIAWGQIVRSLRSTSLGDMFDWFLLFVLMAGFPLAPNWLTRGVVFLIWITRWHERAAAGLRADLAVIPLYQSLPIPIERRLLAEIGRPVLLATLLGWLGWYLGGSVGFSLPPLALFVLFPLIVVNTAYSALYDVLRQTHPKHLTTGSIPPPGVAAVLVSIAVLIYNYLLLVTFGIGPAGLLAAVIGNVLAQRALVGICKRSYLNMGK